MITDDDVVEDTEEFSLTINLDHLPLNVIGVNYQTSVSIIDDDGMFTRYLNTVWEDIFMNYTIFALRRNICNSVEYYVHYKIHRRYNAWFQKCVLALILANLF